MTTTGRPAVIFRDASGRRRSQFLKMATLEELTADVSEGEAMRLTLAFADGRRVGVAEGLDRRDLLVYRACANGLYTPDMLAQVMGVSLQTVVNALKLGAALDVAEQERARKHNRRRRWTPKDQLRIEKLAKALERGKGWPRKGRK